MLAELNMLQPEASLPPSNHLNCGGRSDPTRHQDLSDCAKRKEHRADCGSSCRISPSLANHLAGDIYILSTFVTVKTVLRICNSGLTYLATSDNDQNLVLLVL